MKVFLLILIISLVESVGSHSIQITCFRNFICGNISIYSFNNSLHIKTIAQPNWYINSTHFNIGLIDPLNNTKHLSLTSQVAKNKNNTISVTLSKSLSPIFCYQTLQINFQYEIKLFTKGPLLTNGDPITYDDNQSADSGGLYTFNLEHNCLDLYNNNTTDDIDNNEIPSTLLFNNSINLYKYLLLIFI